MCVFSGRTRGLAIRSVSLLNRGGAERVADAAAAGARALAPAGHHRATVPPGPPAVGGQLRPPVRLSFRLSSVVRAAAVHHHREVRHETEDRSDLGVPARFVFHVRDSCCLVLHHSSVRLRNLQVF